MVAGEVGSGVTANAWVIISALAMSHKPRINCGVLLAALVLDLDWQRLCLHCSPFSESVASLENVCIKHQGMEDQMTYKSLPGATRGGVGVPEDPDSFN